jgi:DNA (cytosine-5)-methyltransferase 1
VTPPAAVTHRGVTDDSVTNPGRDYPGTSRPGLVTGTAVTLQKVTDSRPVTAGLILSLFPGIDLLGRGFEMAGYCVVRGPDLIFGGDIRNFHAPAGAFSGVIGGSPCQDFSKRRRSAPTGYGREMLAEFERLVLETRPAFWLLENVPDVPDLKISGYSWQRLDLRASEFGLTQSRLRHFQFGSVTGRALILDRRVTVDETEPCCMATEGSKPGRRDWGRFCELQGLPADFDLPSFTLAAKYQAVGNGVPVPMAMAIALAIRYPAAGQPCRCSCGRPLAGNQQYATAACRKRMQRRRDNTVIYANQDLIRVQAHTENMSLVNGSHNKQEKTTS